MSVNQGGLDGCIYRTRKDTYGKSFSLVDCRSVKFSKCQHCGWFPEEEARRKKLLADGESQRVVYLRKNAETRETVEIPNGAIQLIVKKANNQEGVSNDALCGAIS